ncbi:hypothetical protein [Latilactobacillus sakei]|uniref:hypothetical protein n=1 Tax=Latilactobacillus sakei TaxID=1599 RepID=UPI000B95E111|nr:hypothetical protein [Latilactobacillus sakei]AST83375.1 hypothetical protein LBS_02125 [Latilactobacillus sakei]
MKKHFIYKILPLIVGIILFTFFGYIKLRYNQDYSTIKGFRSVFESINGFVSIVIGFYSAFYGMIISMNKASFFVTLRKSKMKKTLPRILLYALLSAFATLILTMSLQILVNYPNYFTDIIYFVWVLVVGVFLTYALQTSVLSLAIVFFGEDEEISQKRI